MQFLGRVSFSKLQLLHAAGSKPFEAARLDVDLSGVNLRFTSVLESISGLTLEAASTNNSLEQASETTTTT